MQDMENMSGKCLLCSASGSKCGLTSSLENGKKIATFYDSIQIQVPFDFLLCAICAVDVAKLDRGLVRYRKFIQKHVERNLRAAEDSPGNAQEVPALQAKEVADPTNDKTKEIVINKPTTPVIQPAAEEKDEVSAEVENVQLVLEVAGRTTRFKKPVKNHICKTCGKYFRSPYHLKRHINGVHLKMQNFGCDLCKKKFSLKHDLKIHVQHVHSADRYACQICKKTFKTKQNLVRHYVVHSDLHSFACSVCRLKYKRKYNVTRHIQNVHKGVGTVEV